MGSDGKTFNMLFPNKLDTNNQISAGNHQFPRPNWRVRAGGPSGKSYLLAVVTPTKREISKDMDMSSVFPSAPATGIVARTLIPEPSGDSADSSERGMGTSNIAVINEVQ